MTRYEWRKLRRGPAVAAALLLALKIALFAIQCAHTQYSKAELWMEELYAGYSLQEIAAQIDADIAEAARQRNAAELYSNGQITIDEYRELIRNAGRQGEKYSALLEIRERVDSLMGLQATYESALAGGGERQHARWIRQWRPLRLLRETGWNAMLAMERLSFLGYAVILLIVPFVSEPWNARMHLLIGAAGNGWKHTLRAKKSVAFGALLLIWAAECLIDYGLPGLVWGYGALDSAIQSVNAFSNVVTPWSTGGYLTSACLIRLCGVFFLCSFTGLLSLTIRSSYGVMAMALGVYALLDMLEPWRWTVDKLFVPGSFCTLYTEPAKMIAVFCGYLAAGALLQVCVQQYVRRAMIADRRKKMQTE